MLEAGIKNEKKVVVSGANSAQTMGSGTLDVFATPAMVALMEGCAHESVADYLEEGSGTVGISMNVKHVAATPIGMYVRCESELTKVDGRILTFTVKAYDDKELIGEGEHQRCIIYNERFQDKANAKLIK